MTMYVCNRCGCNRLIIETAAVITSHDNEYTLGEPDFDDNSQATCTNCSKTDRLGAYRVEPATGPDDMTHEELANLLTDGVQADVWTDAPECQHRITIIQDAMAEAAHRLTQTKLPAICQAWLNDDLDDAEFADELRKYLKAQK